ncbi:MAG: hypothetical protein ABSG29_13310 [Steroidobacteraceae bacterium]|jgi:hypothetical protein
MKIQVALTDVSADGNVATFSQGERANAFEVVIEDDAAFRALAPGTLYTIGIDPDDHDLHRLADDGGPAHE